MDEKRSINRRDFLKLGVAGAAAFSLTGVGNLLGGEPAATLAYRTLGRTGLKVTTVSFGAMLTPEYEVIRAGLDMGINYVDTARRYLKGKSEEVVGKALKGIRDKVYVATKTQPASNTRDEIVKDVETSLTELQTDHIDVIQLHSLDNSNKQRAFIPEVREALLKLRQQGKVRFFGVTTHTNQAEVVNAIVDDPTKFFDTVLVGFNFKTDPAVKQAIAQAAKAGIGVVAMKTQAGGYKTEELGPVSPHQAALKWVLQDTNVTNGIPGMKTLDQVKEMIAVMGMKVTRTDEQILRRYSQAIDPYYCRLCGECEGTCPKGVDISVINRSLMYAEGYGEYALGKATFDEVRTASLCSTCSGCVARCVNGLNIAEKMRQARSLFA
jgi:predicted aldo/keto reductase-like oxidoreductase